MSKPNFKEPISNIERVIEEWKDQLTENDWYIISIYQILSEPFIEKWKDMVDWHNISAWQKLSESFIEKWKNELDWPCISIYQKLSEPFIEKFQDEVKWVFISEYQTLSEPFIEKFQDRMDWICLSENPNILWNKISEEFFDRYNEYLDLEEINKTRPFSNKFCFKYNLDSRWS